MTLSPHTNQRAPHRSPPDRPEAIPPLARLEALCDSHSLLPVRSQVASRRMGRRARSGDGVLAATGRVAGRPVLCYSQDGGYVGGSVGEAQADTIAWLLRLARRAGVPVVGFVESAGARLQEGVTGLAGYSRIFRESVAASGSVPQLSIIAGVSAGGGSYAPALTDFVIMTERAVMFLTGPAVVREAIREDVTSRELGGPRVHERNGVCHFRAGSELDAARLARRLLSYLPSNRWEEPPTTPSEPPSPSADPGEIVPRESRRVYDVRAVVRALVDRDSLLEIARRWAPNIVTAFARLGGTAIGVVANQPRYLGGVIDTAAAQKAASFVHQCDAFGLPLVVLVDTPGFMPGTRQETAGVIRYGADLVRAFAAARVPRFTVVLRKAYGGAFIAMNSQGLGAELTLAWPSAEIGVMSPYTAVTIVDRDELARSDHPERTRKRLAAAYATEHLNASVAAREGQIDEVIEPIDTRERLEWALTAFPCRDTEEGGRL